MNLADRTIHKLVENHNQIVFLIFILFIFAPLILNNIKILFIHKNIFEGTILSISYDYTSLSNQELIDNFRNNININFYNIAVEIYINGNRHFISIRDVLFKLPNVGDNIKVYYNSKKPFNGKILKNNYKVNSYIEIVVDILFLLYFSSITF